MRDISDEIPVILASGSPRRKELLEQIGISFVVDVSHAQETVCSEDPGKIVEDLAQIKAMDVSSRRADGAVIGADTIVWCCGQVLGKPRDRADARHMIQMLQGRSHSVFTGVSVRCMSGGRLVWSSVFHRETVVHVHSMTDDEIERYLDSGEPWDKAGAYGIQGSFAAYVDGIEGDYLNVVGLPVSALYQELKRMKRELER